MQSQFLYITALLAGASLVTAYPQDAHGVSDPPNLSSLLKRLQNESQISSNASNPTSILATTVPTAPSTVANPSGQTASPTTSTVPGQIQSLVSSNSAATTASSNLGMLLPSSTGNQTTVTSTMSSMSNVTASSTSTPSGSLQSTSTRSAYAVAQPTGLIGAAGAAAVGVLGVMALL